MIPIINSPGYYSFPLDPRLVLWLDSSRLLGVNTALPSDGASVSIWRDLSGWGNHFTQTNGANQPTFKTGAMNGQPSVQFISFSAQYMSRVFTSSMSPSFFSIFLAFQTFEWPALGASQINQIFSKDSGGTVSPFQLYMQGATSTLRGLANNTVPTQVVANTGVQPGINTTYIQDLTFDGTNVISHVNTTNASAALSGTMYQTATGFTIGRDGTSGNRYWNGYIAEILMYNNALSSTERTSVRQYLGNKYNVTVN